MKRSGPIKRKTALKSGDPPARKKRINPSNAARKRRMRRDPETGWIHTYGPYHRWLKGKPCDVSVYGNGHRCDNSKTTGHHRKTVRSGGRDYGNEMVLCRKHHSLIEAEGEARFKRKTGVDPEAAAERWRIEWDRTHPAPRTSKDPDQS